MVLTPLEESVANLLGLEELLIPAGAIFGVIGDNDELQRDFNSNRFNRVPENSNEAYSRVDITSVDNVPFAGISKKYKSTEIPKFHK